MKMLTTIMGIFSALHTAVMASSLCSLMIPTILSTARKTEFHLVSFGVRSLHFSSIISAAALDLLLLFCRLWKRWTRESPIDSVGIWHQLLTPGAEGGRHSDDALAVWIPGHHLLPMRFLLRQIQVSLFLVFLFFTFSSFDWFTRLCLSKLPPLVTVFIQLSVDLKSFEKIRAIIGGCTHSLVTDVELVWMSFRAPASAGNACDPFGCVHANAAEHLPLFHSPCIVPRPRGIPICAVQQSVVMATNSITLMEAFRLFFFSFVFHGASGLYNHIQLQDDAQEF